MQSGYLLDGLDLASEYGIYIEKAIGFWDLPKRKGVTEYSWDDEDGVQVFTDEDDIYFDARDVKLKCFIRASSETDFRTKLRAFRAVLISPGLHTLKFPYGGSMVYNVYFREKSAFSLLTKWSSTELVGRFYIPLREPKPSILITCVNITAPNGGENWQAGTNQIITWTSESVINVKIEYSDDNGASWRVIDYETTSDGIYSWTIPYIDSSTCLVKITETNGYDESNLVFTIAIVYDYFLDSDGLSFLDSDGLSFRARE